MNGIDMQKGGKSLTTLIYDKVREDILKGRYCAGDKIVEIKVADELGVSRTPVREALKQLELHGLVDNIPNRGVIVKGISQEEIKDILVVRHSIEGLVGQWAAERITDVEIKELEDTNDLMSFYLMKQDFDKFYDQNLKFHEIIYSAAKSRYLENVLKDFQFFIKNSKENIFASSDRLTVSLKEHEMIIKALKSRDCVAARKAMVDHIKNANEVIFEIMKG